MGFLTPKPSNDDERLPGAAGLNLDVDPQRCPSCRREVAPWDARCRDCGEEPVPSSQLPGQQVHLPPGLQAMSDDVDAELAAENDAELAAENDAELAAENDAELAAEDDEVDGTDAPDGSAR